jgi:hypothetical protein
VLLPGIVLLPRNSQSFPTHFNTENHEYEDTHAAGCKPTPIDPSRRSGQKQTHYFQMDSMAKAAIRQMSEQHNSTWSPNSAT